MRSDRVETDTHESDVVFLFEVEDEMRSVFLLQKCLGLPPCGRLVEVHVCHKVGRMCQTL